MRILAQLGIFISYCIVSLTGHSIVTAKTLDRPIIIAHRGASGLLPEHTMVAYEMAVKQGADFIEPDLVLTKDHVLVARHDIYLSTTTDVAERPEFAHLKTTKYGRTDWFAEDFTLAEIKQLRAVQPFAQRDQSFNGQFQIPTFSEILIYVRLMNKAGRSVGVYPEIKYQEQQANSGQDVSSFIPYLEIMNAAKMDYYIQSFNPDFLKRLFDYTVQNSIAVKNLIQLISKTKAGTPSVLTRDIGDHITGVGVDKKLLFRADLTPTDYAQNIHNKKLKLHVWTVRDDRLMPQVMDVQEEFVLLSNMKVDGIFTDFTLSAVDYYTQRGQKRE